MPATDSSSPRTRIFSPQPTAGIGLLGADRLVVVVWTADLKTGVIRAGAGTAAAAIGIAVPNDEFTLDIP